MSAGTGARWRWAVARLLDRRKNTCWADLVSWALGSDGYQLPCKQQSACRADMDRNDSCYCGKIRKDPS